jgi:hypothetical protein
MIALRCHTATDYAAFPDIDTADAGTLTAEDRACLDELGRHLVEAGAHTRFGAALLHSHFPIESDETLVEQVFPHSGSIKLRPVRNPPSGLFPTSVCFDEAQRQDGELRLVGLEYASARALAGVAPVDEPDREVLTGVWRTLHQRAKTRRFGIRLLHDPLNLNGRVLLETCDSVHRVLTCTSIAEDDRSFVESIATLFRWVEACPQGDAPAIGQECMVFCKRIQGCALSRDGRHDKSSSHESTHREVRV